MQMRVLNIRKVPEDLYTLVKVRAATCGMTLQEYVIRLLKDATAKKEKS